VRKLRAIARVLNSLIIHKNLEEIDEKVREVLSTALVDVGELSSAVETRVVTGISDLAVHIEAASTGKLFKVS
jgi:transcriptional regulator of heat shock response